ncbi:class D sortase [Schinkia azotoformans]|uniref:Sortase family protein n=1 Tax=Schinkia azotoformans LMG 9581 TaxID=1131731 RepID=K6D8Y4_SCHAZ|nr:class D sortase [Schinkia azotoformans]EKN68977.1 sortase family protein [Schinkia azotoformans LMG 9581]MEC1638429.1 class D sortase [Schinkia azotoformans]MEC1721286.1 class D sortase [Schinkia azotoformans]MEC1946137.1 class D sortase [Schinkia azotoformans]MED4352433.1 class D sortase [Schinkia azotoformans]
MVKKIAIIIIIAGIVLIGIGVFQYFNSKEEQKNTLKEAYKILEDHNQQINNHLNEDHHTKKDEEFNPFHGETVGILEIPKLNAELPIVEGTSDNDLEKGVGHYKGTAYPTEGDQIVLSGHRDTVFRRMGELEVGDVFIVKLPYGSFEYKIESTKIVDADDRTIIKSTAPNEELVVTTCYPFTFVGTAPDRYILTAKPVKMK